MRSTQEDGTMESQIGTGTFARVFKTDGEPVFSAMDRTLPDKVASDKVETSDGMVETPHVHVPGTGFPSFSVSANVSSVSTSGFSTSGKPGTRNIFSVEYQENEVVSPRGMTGSPEEAVFKDDIVDDVLMRKSDDVEESTRNDVFGRVIQENASLRVEPTAVAEEKYPHVLETRCS